MSILRPKIQNCKVLLQNNIVGSSRFVPFYNILKLQTYYSVHIFVFQMLYKLLNVFLVLNTFYFYQEMFLFLSVALGSI